MKKPLLLIFLLSGLLACKKDPKVSPDLVITGTDTIISFRNDTLIRTWKDTILKVVKDSLYTSKSTSLLVTAHDSVVITKYIAAQTSKINLFFLGTSITYGASSSVGIPVPVPANKTYPADVSNFFAGNKSYGAMYNLGIGGAIVDDIINNEVPDVIKKKDVVNYTENVALVEAGINDCASGYAAADIYNSIKSLHALLHNNGIQTVVLTPTSFNNDASTLGNSAAKAEVTRQQLNTMLVNGWKNDIGAVALINVGSNKYVGKFSGNSGFDLDLFQPDGVHFTPLGYSVIAGFAGECIFYLK